MPKKLAGPIRTGDRAPPRVGQVRANFPRVRPRGSPGPARRAATSSCRPQPARRIAAFPRARVDAPAPRSPKVSRRVPEARGRAAVAAASSPRPPGRAPRAHPRRPLLGDRGRHARQRRARCLPTPCWRVSSPAPTPLAVY